MWWENHKINNSRADFETAAHVLGGTSSTSCYKRTAADNEEKYQKEVTDKLIRKIYMDDLLQSMRDVNTTISLLHKVIKLCKGDFWLTKFVSNKVEVLESIPKADGRDGLKNIDINSGSDLPTKRTLGINWDIENDNLGFKVILAKNHTQEE